MSAPAAPAAPAARPEDRGPAGAPTTRRAVLKRAAYVAPAIVAIKVISPAAALGASGPLGKTKGKGKGKGR